MSDPASKNVFWSTAFAVAQRSVRAFFTNKAIFLPALLFPLFFFAAFAGGLSRVDSIPGFDYPPGYTTFVYGFILLQASAFGGVFTSFAIARDFESGFARRMMLAAPRRGGLVAGYWLAALTRALFTICVVTTVALITGAEIFASEIDLLGLFVLALGVNAGTMLFGTGVAMRLRTMQAGPAIQTPVFIILFLAPVWVPFDLLTGWLKHAAAFNPTTLLLETSRGFLAGDLVKVIPAFLIVVIAVGLSWVWAWGGLRSAERAA